MPTNILLVQAFCLGLVLLVGQSMLEVECFQQKFQSMLQRCTQPRTSSSSWNPLHQRERKRTYSSLLHYGGNENEEGGGEGSPSSERKPTKDYELEETLLRVHLSPRPGVDIDDALGMVSKYTTSFPFAAVLPVQPLNYLPTPDGGVDVKFLRKKTKEKGSLDGGIRFFIGKERDGIEILAKRNSDGQTVPKIFSERLVVQAYAKGISGDEVEKTGMPPIEFVALDSIFHKWME